MTFKEFQSKITITGTTLVAVSKTHPPEKIKEIYNTIKAKAPCEVIPRSLRLNSSSIPIEHELVQAGIQLGRETYGSPTLSDQAILSCSSLKLGPGDSKRSHSADEYIYLHEIEEGIDLYIKLLDKVL